MDAVPIYPVFNVILTEFPVYAVLFTYKVGVLELTDKTIQANRDVADEKTQKQLDLASGTGAAIAAASKSPPPQQAEGGALANPKIKGSPYIDVYNTTSQF